VSRYKIVFLIVLVAVGLFIASVVASMFATKQKLANGYELSVGGKGEVWIRSPDRQTQVTDVTSVWLSADRMLVERRTADDKPPFKDRDCDYLVAEGRGALHPVSNADAQALASTLERRAGSARACIPAKG
jgi:hypothetical protein